MTKEADKLEKLCEIDRLKRSFSDDEIDFTIAENQNKYISDSLEVIELAYKQYKDNVASVLNNKKYSHTYKTEKTQELKEQFILFKDLQLSKARESVAQMRGILQGIDDLEKEDKDPLLTELTKMNLLNMMNIGLKFEDDTFIKSKISEIIEYEDLKTILQNKIKKTKKGHLLSDIEAEYQSKNAKYINLDKLDNQLQTMRSYKDTVFNRLDMSKLEIIK